VSNISNSNLNLALKFYRQMKIVRRFEESVIELSKKDLVKGTIHPYIGQEAVAVGICESLNKKDYMTSTHRGHGHFIAKGGDVQMALAEILGKKTGCCKGRGGSMHLTDPETNNLGANGIVGGSLGIAVGAALGSVMQREANTVVVSFFGEGATNQGVFHESLNLASLWALPVVFVGENNKYAVSTNYKNSTAVEPVKRATAYNIKAKKVDGNDVFKVYHTVKELISFTRNGNGPTLVECDTYRWEGHYYGEPRVYRSSEEEEAWKAKCPIKNLKQRIINGEFGDFNNELLVEIDDEVEMLIQKAVEFAIDSEEPSPERVKEWVYSS
jgi:TPP-dependent pyruvate/acetoin dehydrogenase alpha subunit